MKKIKKLSEIIYKGKKFVSLTRRLVYVTQTPTLLKKIVINIFH